MHHLTNFKQANAQLLKFVPTAKKYKAAVVSLQNMSTLMESLGNPQDTYKTIHVAGTSGKTSTSYYIASFLHQAGKKIGLTVSPHVDEVNERVQINLTPLPEAEFCKQLSTFLNMLDKITIKPSYFEVLVAFAFWQFAQDNVDYAVIEVGMGGRLDATNIISSADKVCVITDIGLDHTEFLGNTLDKVAAEKAGIIQHGNHIFINQQDTAVLDIVKTAANEHQSLLHIINEPPADQLPLSLPLFQKRNWHLAEQVCNYISQRDDLDLLDDAEQQKVIHTYIPARMEMIRRGGKTIILDGSHNAQKLHALITSITARFPNQPIAALVSFGAGDTNRLHGGMDEIMKSATSIIATKFDVGQDAHRLPVEPGKIKAYATKHGIINTSAEPDPETAFKILLTCKEPLLLVTGSFYLISHIRPLLNKLENV